MEKRRKPTYGAGINMAKLVHVLCTQTRSMTLTDVLRVLGVSARTAGRYLKVINEHLSNEDGEPLIRVYKAGGVERWQLNEPMDIGVTPYQLASLWVGSLLMKFLGGTVVQDGLLDVYEYLESKAPLLKRNMLRKKFHYTAFGSKQYRDFDDQIDVVLKSLLLERKLRITYSSSRRKKQYLIHPYTLLMHKESLYLSAYVEEYSEIRTFLVENILDAELIGEKFQYPAQYSPEALFDKSFGIFVADTDTGVKVVIEFPQQMHPYITSRNWIPNQQFSRVRNGKFRMTVQVSDLFEIMHWVMQFGSAAKVIRPQKLKKLIREEARTIFEQS